MKNFILLFLFVIGQCFVGQAQNAPKVNEGIESLLSANFVPQKADTIVAMYTYVENNRRMLDLTPKQAEAMGVDQECYNKYLAIYEHLNQLAQKSEEEGVPVVVGGRSREYVGKPLDFPVAEAQK